MKSLLAVSVVVCAVVFSFSPAHAGFKQYVPIGVGTNYAEGTVGSARNSADARQSIGCGIYATSGVATLSAMCSA
ncbi:hypothetical protein, partial [Enterococcus avium]